MNTIEIIPPKTNTYKNGYRVDSSRGERNNRVSSEWFSRPDDERFLSLDDLYVSVRTRAIDWLPALLRSVNDNKPEDDDIFWLSSAQMFQP